MILLFLKSIIIGVANIIPGVSGGTLAVMLNVYDPITEKIGNFFLVDRKTKLSYFFYLLVVLIGAGTGIFLFANIIKYSITNYPKITVTVFTLLILPSIPYIVKGLDYKKKKSLHISGICKTTLNPPYSLCFISICPLWTSIICFTIRSPKPCCCSVVFLSQTI